MSDAAKARQLLKAAQARKLLKESKSKSEDAAPIRDKHSISKTAKEHFTEGLALGHGDTIAGGINKVLDKGMRATHKLGLTGPSPYQVDEQLLKDGATGDLQADSYQDGVNDRRELLAETAQDNPKTAFASDMAGGLVTSGLAAAATGGVSLAGEGAVVGTGYGDSDTLGGMAQDAAAGAVLGKYGGKVLSKAGGLAKGAIKKITPNVAKSIYSAIARKTGGKQPEKVIEGIKYIEEKTGLFTEGEGSSISAESVEQGLNSFYNTAQENLNKLTNTIAKNVRPKEMVEGFKPLVTKMDSMIGDVISNTTNTELANKLTKSKALLQNAMESGDYQRVVNIMNQEVKEGYVSFSPLDELKVSKPIRAKMKQLLGDFDGINKGLIGDIGGKKAAEEFAENMTDLKHYYKVAEVVKKNVGKEAAGGKTRIMDFVIGGAVGAVFSNPILTAAYIKGSSELRNPVVQGFLAKSYKAVPRAFEPVKEVLTNSPIAGVLLDSLPEEIGHLVQKIEAGVRIPTVQQHLVVKGMTSMFPELFEHSEYESEVDGKLTDPYEVKMEKQRIMKDSSMSNIEKYKQVNSLNKDGTILRNTSTARGTVQPINDQQKADLSKFLQAAEGMNNGTN